MSRRRRKWKNEIGAAVRVCGRRQFLLFRAEGMFGADLGIYNKILQIRDRLGGNGGKEVAVRSNFKRKQFRLRFDFCA